MKLLSAAILIGLALMTSGGTANCCTAASPLVPPPGFIQANKSVRPAPTLHACDDFPEPYTGALDFPSKFKGSDSARDDLNKAAEREYRNRTSLIKAAEKRFSQLVEEHVKTGANGPAACAIAGLASWAEQDALSGESQTHTGKAVRKWALGSFASAYLLLQHSSMAPLEGLPRESEKIEKWFSELAQYVVTDWETSERAKINNHEYWAAWSVIAVATVSNDPALFEWALKIYRIAASQIDPEGFLPNELSRRTRALFYHNYALPPLAMIAAFAEANGVPVLDYGDQALVRLAENVARGIENPVRFVERTDAEQRMDKLRDDSKFTWLEPYCWLRSCDGPIGDMLESRRPVHNYRVGGDVSHLFADRALVSSAQIP